MKRNEKMAGWMVGWLAGLTGLLVERNYFKNPGRQPLINALRSLEPGLLFVMTLLCQACVLRSLAGLHKLKTFFFFPAKIDMLGELICLARLGIIGTERCCCCAEASSKHSIS